MQIKLNTEKNQEKQEKKYAPLSTTNAATSSSHILIDLVYLFLDKVKKMNFNPLTTD